MTLRNFDTLRFNYSYEIGRPSSQYHKGGALLSSYQKRILTFNKELASFNVLNCDYKIAAEAIASRKTLFLYCILTRLVFYHFYEYRACFSKFWYFAWRWGEILGITDFCFQIHWHTTVPNSRPWRFVSPPPLVQTFYQLFNLMIYFVADLIAEAKWKDVVKERKR